MKQYDDFTKLTFGTYRGKALGQVPMHYLNELWDKPGSPLQKAITEDTEEGALARYIRSARKAEGKGDS